MCHLSPLQVLPVTKLQLESAHQWLKHQRKHFPPQAGIWFLIRDWNRVKDDLLTTICHGDYQFSALRCKKVFMSQ